MIDSRPSALQIGVFAAAVLLLLGGGCERPVPVRVKNARLVMGTQAEITACAADRATAQRAIEAAYGRLEDVNRLMSDYVADSEIVRLNALSAGESLVVSPETFHCLERAAEVSRLSGGAFDVTCRPLVWLWKQAGKESKLPTEAALQETLECVGWQKLRLEPQARSVTPTADGMQIDLGGIAKGYALDLAAEAMKRAGATSGLVDVGGDVVAIGTRADGQSWRIGVRDPFAGRTSYICTLDLTDRAVATSGKQERFIEIEGKHYSHVYDPRTGWAAQHAASVTVVAGDGLTADAWATAFSVLSVEEGLKLLEQGRLTGIEVLWITREDGHIAVQYTPGFGAYIDRWTVKVVDRSNDGRGA